MLFCFILNRRSQLPIFFFLKFKTKAFLDKWGKEIWVNWVFEFQQTNKIYNCILKSSTHAFMRFRVKKIGLLSVWIKVWFKTTHTVFLYLSFSIKRISLLEIISAYRQSCRPANCHDSWTTKPRTACALCKQSIIVRCIFSLVFEHEIGSNSNFYADRRIIKLRIGWNLSEIFVIFEVPVNVWTLNSFVQNGWMHKIEPNSI